MRLNWRGLLSAFGLLALLGASPSVAQTMPDLVSRDRLRVCAPPANMPFSDKAQQGFENKIAELVAGELKVPLHYFWMPEGPGFVHNTLLSDMCDLIVGYASESDLVDHSNPYYASTYVLVTRKGGPLDGVNRLSDPRLKNAKLGVIAATPPVDHLMALGVYDHVKSYSLLVDRRYSSPAEDALRDLAAGENDAVILWGPIGGYFAKVAKIPLTVTPLVTDKRPQFIYRIAFGMRRGETDWKEKLNAIIRKRQKDIDAILESYGVPLMPIAAAPIDVGRRERSGPH
ncbi:quinoprotein dehydrogenase-associated putative ABC transporter substrate-binding protein [Rhodoblastus acidophilus]|uniref:Quinoprotein dehydrogenase-associated putative ABC transporter substrate-binding protein n=1 Tax=Candidatus Rhodoblastus alkanivorans TaxID=2954117 RepID=A0ABS9Z5C4_9HYPH|nr:quinoprotein dehydrogenase-associated putative ABC transporter substrate-binding protein [Candidatus Rhodoblastus alkanivorans]MCI4680202.1 quinoprotein dehydrogenase-associated putative ABC transporter substrate-binding protein [Candidatus Rhodoblastus alkanivorans]MCI4682276.1 quinoprotein dehydrogenase-associated putative ABC transporter substrate-binding protein [Candidatus Rhodoblastus alkanivorans]MDI4639578.1 quinoprotein dehydrogenase-associated putative ABC transporter substrate-bind